MLFSKAIEIKSLVNGFNKGRKDFGRQPIVFTCGMFSLGDWFVNLSAPDGGIFYSTEAESISSLVSGGDITFWIGCSTFAPVLFFE